jgi:hypothetical protein
VKSVKPRPIFGAVILAELLLLGSVAIIAPVVSGFALGSVDFVPADAVVDEDFGGCRTGLVLAGGVGGLSFGRLVRKAPRTFSSSCWPGRANANPPRANTKAQDIILNFISNLS